MSTSGNDNQILHWNYFLALESDLANISRFIEFSPPNFKTYSIELAHLFLATASEIDVVAKQLCNLVAPVKKADNIGHYREILLSAFPDFANQSVFLPRYGLELVPWSNWLNEATPHWWSDHNQVKHHRADAFNKANLENVLLALSGLFLILLYYYRQQSTKISLDPVPSLFEASRSLVKRDLFLGGHISLHFEE